MLLNKISTLKKKVTISEMPTFPPEDKTKHNKIIEFLNDYNFYSELENETLTEDKIKSILDETIKQYLDKKIDLDFLTLLAVEIFDNNLSGNVKDPKLSQVLCGLSDIYFGLEPKEAIDEILEIWFKDD
jgi:hypothetical protein